MWCISTANVISKESQLKPIYFLNKKNAMRKLFKWNLISSGDDFISYPHLPSNVEITFLIGIE